MTNPTTPRTLDSILTDIEWAATFGNMTIEDRTKFTHAIRQLVDEVIGRDGTHDSLKQATRNELRAEQRDRAKQKGLL